MTSATEAPTPKPSAKRHTAPRRAPHPAPGAGPAGFAPLATERLMLRPLIPADAATLHRLVNDWEVTRNLAVVPFPYPRDLADEWIASTSGLAAGQRLSPRDHRPRRRAGDAGRRRRPACRREARRGRLGYWVGRRFWGHGVATEAAGRLARWALANLNLERLEAGVATDNPASAAVLRRIGFRQTGRGTDRFRARGGEHPVWRFEATRDDIFGHAEARGIRGSGNQPLRTSCSSHSGHSARAAPVEPGTSGRRRGPSPAAGRRLCADRQRRPGAAGAPAGRQEDGRPVGISRRQARTGRNAGGRADPRAEGRAGHRRIRRLPRRRSPSPRTSTSVSIC